MISERRRLHSPATTPQALAWDRNAKLLWMGSRDLHRIYAIDPKKWTVSRREKRPAFRGQQSRSMVKCGLLSAKARMTIVTSIANVRLDFRKCIACPEFTGSYLSFDGRNLYLSQRDKKRILQVRRQR